MYEFEKEIKDIDLTEILNEKSDEIYELNAGEWYFEWHDNNILAKKFSEVLDETSFRWTNFTTHWIIGEECSYWCGCLTLEPFCELDEGEEVILDWMLHENTEIVFDGERLLMRFKPDESVTLHKFFSEYTDGYGENISSSYKCMRRHALKVLKKRIEKDLESDYRNKFGEWKQEVWEDEYE